MDVHGSTIPPDVDSSTLLYNFNSSDTAGHGAQRSSHAHVFTDVLLGSFGAMGVLSNIAVLGILLQKKHRREAANLYLVNLAIGMSMKKHVLLFLCRRIVPSPLVAGTADHFFVFHSSLLITSSSLSTAIAISLQHASFHRMSGLSLLFPGIFALNNILDMCSASLLIT